MTLVFIPPETLLIRELANISTTLSFIRVPIAHTGLYSFPNITLNNSFFDSLFIPLISKFTVCSL